MSGVLLAAASMGRASDPWAALMGAWNDISGATDAENNDVVIPEDTTITASADGDIATNGQPYYTIDDGSPVDYTAPFAISAGQTLRWGCQTKSGCSGTASVFRTGSILVDEFDITLTG